MLQGPATMIDPNYSFGEPSHSYSSPIQHLSSSPSPLDPPRRASIPTRRFPLVPITSMPLEGYRFGASDSPRASQDSLQPSSSTNSNSSRPSSSRQPSFSRRASLPPYVGTPTASHPYLPSPRHSTYRHRPSIASTITNCSTSTNTTGPSVDETSIHYQDNRELAGIYKDLQSYVFGEPSPSSSSSSPRDVPPSIRSQNSPAYSTSAASPFSPSPRLYDNRRKNSATLSISAHSASTGGTNPLGITVGAAMGKPSNLSTGHGDYDESNNSDAGSAYSPDNDQDHTAPFHKESWNYRDHSLSPQASTADSMDVDSALGRSDVSHRVSPSRREEKKRDRSGKDEGGAVTDEDDSVRRNERGKMRAIDDGSRRPSLPFNVPHSTSPINPIHSPTVTSRREAGDRDSAQMPHSDLKQAVVNFSTGTGNPLSLSTTNIIDPSSSSSSIGSPAVSSPPKPNRPRSRSHRIAKPPLSPGAVMNPEWNPNWANAADSASTIPLDSVPLSPTSVNPFTQLARSRGRSTTVTQSQIISAFAPLPSDQESPPPTAADNPPDDVALGLPTDGTGATADFDLDFIFSGTLQPPVGSPTGPIMRKASLAPSLTPSLDDTFIRFVNQFDDEYGERRDKWSYRLDGNSSELPPVPGAEGYYWNCANMGRYWVGKEGVGGVGDDVLHHVGASSLDGFTPENSIVIRFCPPVETPPPTEPPSGRAKSFSPPPVGMDDLASQEPHTHSQSTPGSLIPNPGRSYTPGPQLKSRDSVAQRRSNVRIQAKKHQKAPAFTLYLGPRHPRSLGISRPTLLLAPKAFHLHATAPPKGGRGVTSTPTTRSRGHTINNPGTSSGTVLGNQLLSSTPARPSSLSRTFSAGNTAGWPTSVNHAAVRTSSSTFKTDDPTLLERIKTGSTAAEQPFSLSSFPQAHNVVPPYPTLPPSPGPVSLDLLSVAAATGRMTSAHNHAFDTLSPEDGQVILEHLKHRSSLGLRLKRAFGGINSSSKDSSTGSQHSTHSVHSEDPHGSGSRSGSPPTSGKHGKDHKKGDHDGMAHQNTPLEGAFEPPWLLMTPMYVKEAVIAAERSMYTGFASLGLAAPPSHKKNRRPHAPSSYASVSASFRRNSILESVPNEAMCMVLPLWDLTLDLEEERRKRRAVIDDLDLDLGDLEEEDGDEDEDGMDVEPQTRSEWEALERRMLAKELKRRRQMQPPPKMDRKYLLTYYVPFNSKKGMLHSGISQSIPAPTAPEPTKKKRSRPQASSVSSASRRSTTTPPEKDRHAVRSFRVVARILTPLELRDSGLSPPSNITDPKRFQQQSTTYYSSALNYSRMDRRLSSASLFGDSVPSAFSAVIAVCHDRRKGVEFVPEGLDSLGLCGGESMMSASGATVQEKLPPLFPPAHLVPVEERFTPPLNAVGKQIVEMIWSGCLALTELGI